MERLVLIAKSHNQGLFYSKRFENEKDTVVFEQIINSQRRGSVITYVKENNSRHRWDVDVIDFNDGEKKASCLITNSRRNARLIAKDLKKYDNTLKIKINKIY